MMENKSKNSRIPWETSLRYDAWVLGLILLVFITALGLKSWVESKAIIFTDPDTDLSLSYPALWVSKAEKGTILSVQDLLSESVFKVKFSVDAIALDLAEDTVVQDLIQPFIEERVQEIPSYRMLKTNDTEVAQLDGVMVWYTYIYDPEAGSLQTYLPTVVRGVDILVIREATLYIFSFAAPEESFSEYSMTLDAILRSVHFDLED